MSLIKQTLQKLAATGEMTHECTVGGTKFVFKVLNTEEQLLADTLVDVNTIKEKYAAHERMSTLADTLSKFRSLARIALAIKSVDGQAPVDTSKSLPEQFKQRMELREELLSLDPYVIDKLINEYSKLTKKQSDFFGNLEENAEK